MSDGVTRRRRAGGREVFVAQVRVRPGDGSKDIFESKHFDDYDDAVRWKKKRTGEIRGLVEAGKRPSKAPKGSFGAALRWGIDKLTARMDASKLAGRNVDGHTSNDKNLRSKLRWWLWVDEDDVVERKAVTNVALSTINKFMLEAQTKAALAAGDGGVQTQIHRINAVSWLYEAWRAEQQLPEADLPTPTDGARMSAPSGRERRCRDAEAAGEDQDEEAALLAEARLSNSKWLAPAIVIAMDTAIRQEELVLLEWRKHVFLEGKKPHLHLMKDIVKGARGADGGKARTVRLKKRTIEAFRELKALNEETVAKWNADHPDRPKKVSHKPLPVAGTRAIGHAWDKLIAGARAKAVANGIPLAVVAGKRDTSAWLRRASTRTCAERMLNSNPRMSAPQLLRSPTNPAPSS